MITTPPAEQPITAADDVIARALDKAKTLPLMMTVVHLTGDTSLLDEVKASGMTLQNMDGDLGETDRAKVRARALDALIAYRDGRAMPPSPSDDVLKRMAESVAGTHLTDDYVEMLTEDMALTERPGLWDAAPRPRAVADFHTLVIGAGMSGLLQARELSRAGLPFTIVEKNDEVGGTWFENSYPGCRVDSSNHFYSYSFEPNNDWSEYYSQQGELLGYFRRCAEKFGLRDRIRFGTEVIEARYEEGSGLWAVRLRTRDGEETLRVNAVVSAVGQLNRPKIPDFPGRETFAGPQFHAAAWEAGHDLAGKRIAVIGAGATAFQLIPEMAKIASKLTCFQRSPGWMAPNPIYHDAVDPDILWLLKHVPFYQRWYRFCLFWNAGDGTLRNYTIDPDWSDGGRSINALNAMQREVLGGAMASQLAGRDDLAAQLIPPYPPGGKRLLQDNGSYLRALQRDNVEVVADGIREVVADGVIDNAGRHHPLDVILYATGFHANKFLWPMTIVGRGGQELAALWGDTPRAHLGITVPGFPNLYCIYGPGTNLAHGGSIIFHSECQVRYIMGCVKLSIERGEPLEVRQDSYDRYVEALEAKLATMVWSHPGVSSWYKNARGLVVNTSPWRLVDYWRWTQRPDPADFREPRREAA